VPTDRPIDGIDASKFLLGESPISGRESILFFGPDGSLMSAKWHNIKVVLRYSGHRSADRDAAVADAVRPRQ
jgi:hypothetical protein